MHWSSLTQNTAKLFLCSRNISRSTYVWKALWRYSYRKYILISFNNKIIKLSQDLLNLLERKQQFSIILKSSFEWVFSLNALIFGIQIFVFVSFWNNFDIFQVNDFKYHLSWLKTEGDHMSINLRLDWWLKKILFCLHIFCFFFCI